MDCVSSKYESYDILERFPIDLCHYWLRHLNAKELLAMSAVNKKWNELVDKSPQVEKLKLVIKENELTSTTRDILMNSKRKYQHIEVKVSQKNCEYFLSILAHRAGSWKSVIICSCGPTTQDMWPRLLEIVEPSIEKLGITDNFYGDEEPPNVASVWTFPRLKILYCGSHRNFYKYFGRVTTLEDFPFLQVIQEAKPAIRDLLRNNKNLEKMFLFADVEMLNELSLGIGCKLKELTIMTNFEVLSYTNSGSFLETQAQTLESLEICNPVDHGFLSLVLRMPKLTKFAFGKLISEDMWSQEFPVNNTVTTLTVSSAMSVRERIAFRSLVRALQKLKHLRCGTIQYQMLAFLAQNVPALESLKCKNFDAYRLPEGNVFPNMKSFTITHKYRGNLRIVCGDNNFTKLVTQEMERIDTCASNLHKELLKSNSRIKLSNVSLLNSL